MGKVVSEGQEGEYRKKALRRNACQFIVLQWLSDSEIEALEEYLKAKRPEVAYLFKEADHQLPRG